MGRLTLEERRRVFVTQEQARHTRLTPLASASTTPHERSPRHSVIRLFKTTMIVTLLGCGWLAYQFLGLHLPASILEVVLPRL
jgi:hypothetical protein